MHVIGEVWGAECVADGILGGGSGEDESAGGIGKLRRWGAPALMGAEEQGVASVRLDRRARDVAGVAELSVGHAQGADAAISDVAGG